MTQPQYDPAGVLVSLETSSAPNLPTISWRLHESNCSDLENALRHKFFVCVTDGERSPDKNEADGENLVGG